MSQSEYHSDDTKAHEHTLSIQVTDKSFKVHKHTSFVSTGFVMKSVRTQREEETLEKKNET